MMWHLVERETPPVGKPLILTVKDVSNNIEKLRYPMIYRQSLFTEEFHYYECGFEEGMVIEEFSKPIAWMEFPSPYRDGDRVFEPVGGEQE